MSVTFGHLTQSVQISFHSLAEKKRYYAKPDFIAPNGSWREADRAISTVPVRDLAPGKYLTVVQPCAPGDATCTKEPSENRAPIAALP